MGPQSDDPAGWDSYCKGDKRTLLHPSRRLRVDQSGQSRGAENVFVMERPSDGGLYRAGRGLQSKNFEFPGYCVLRAN